MIVFLIVMSCVFNCFFCFDRVSWHKVCRCFVELLERTERLGSTNTKASVFRRLQSLVVTMLIGLNKTIGTDLVEWSVD